MTRGADDEDAADYEQELVNQTAASRRDVARKRIPIHLLRDLREFDLCYNGLRSLICNR